jgi:hypothetical protein
MVVIGVLELDNEWSILKDVSCIIIVLLDWPGLLLELSDVDSRCLGVVLDVVAQFCEVIVEIITFLKSVPELSVFLIFAFLFSSCFELFCLASGRLIKQLLSERSHLEVVVLSLFEK